MDHDTDGDVFPVNNIDSVNISDVIEIIAQDEAYDLNTAAEGALWQEEEAARAAVGGGAVMSGGGGGGGGPRCVIVEQPASKALRFRYECEGRSAGSIPGINSTAENKTFPTIQIENYTGRAVVVVSCVTKDAPYRPHPHSLVGKEGCKQGVCTMEVNTETMSLSFANLGIQCIKKKDIDAALDQRKQLRIDPFKTGYGHKNQPGTIDLNAVRLCFQVFLEGDKKNQFSRPIMPVVSEPIYDKKAMSDLVICKLSEVSASVIGGKEIILLCEKVTKEDISVRLYEELNGQVLWEGQCDFQPTEVHKQVAISFRTPSYKNIEVTEPVKVMIQLVRPSDKATSEPRPFLLTPIDAVRRKRPKVDTSGMLEHLKEAEMQMRQSEASLVKLEIKLERDAPGASSSGAYGGPLQMMYQRPVSQLSPVYRSPGASPAPASDFGAIPANPDYIGITPAATYSVMPATQHVYPPHASPFSPAAQSVASPPEHQASVSPLPQMAHQLDQINNLNIIQQQLQQQHVTIDNNLNIIQQGQHSPMQHNIDNNLNMMQQGQQSPMQHNIDNNLNMMQQGQQSPMQHNIDNNLNMMQQGQQSPMQRNIDNNLNMIQQGQASPLQHNIVNNIDDMVQQQQQQQQQHNEHVVMDMDTQQHSIELSAGRLDSRDLRELDLDGLDSVSENLSSNLRLNDAAGSDSMTDSLSRIPSNSLIFYPNNGNNFPASGGNNIL